MASIDNIFVIVSVFGLALVFLVALVMWNSLVTDPVDEMIWQHNPTSQAIQDSGQSVYNSLDLWFVLIFFFLHLGILLLAWALRTHPIIYVAGIFLIVIATLLSAPLSNAWEELENNPTLSATVATMPKTNLLMNKLPVIEVVVGFFTLVVMAGLARTEGFI